MQPSVSSNLILKFSAVSYDMAVGYDTAIEDLSFDLAAGELLLIRLEAHHRDVPIPDLAAGLLEPKTGNVEFMGQDWQTMSARQVEEQRGTIGRTFSGKGWLSNLDIEENIFLAQRYHDAQSDVDLAAQADGLAKAFGFPGVPPGRPAAARPIDLRRLDLVRAFLCRPKLLILESPPTETGKELTDTLVKKVNALCDGGGAALWTTLDPAVWDHAELKKCRRMIMSGTKLQPIAELQARQ